MSAPSGIKKIVGLPVHRTGHVRERQLVLRRALLMRSSIARELRKGDRRLPHSHKSRDGAVG